MRLVRIVAVAGSVLIATAACGGGGGSSTGAGGTPVLQIPTDPGVLDPQTSPGSWGRPMMRMAYDTLVADGPNGVVPQLAESWDVTPTTATFKIRDGITCGNGAAMDAAAVAANFERLKDPAAKVPFTASFLGSTTYKVSFDAAARTVTLALPAPFSPLLSNLAAYPGMICPEGLQHPEKLNEASFGTGPYTLVDVKAGQSYTFQRRDDYTWGPGGATSKDLPSRVEISVVSNETTAANLMLSGELSLGIFTARGAYDRLAGDRFASKVVPASATYMHFNFLKQSSPIQDVAVRRVLAASVDRAALAKIATGSADQLSNSVALPQSPCQREVTDEGLVRYDTAQVPSLLTGAGWTKSGNGWTKNGQKLAINLLVTGPAGAGNKPIADYVLNAWNALGIEVNVDNVDQKTGIDRRAQGTYDVWLGAWTSVFNPAIISPFLTSPKSPNYSYLANAAYNELAKQAYDMDPEQTCAVWAKAQTAINEQVSMVPEYYDATHYISSKGLQFEPYRSFIEPTSLRASSK
ncbi:ABC transporter substrate-binding protein [Dactylosporangium sp. CA-092794]|uniref:ABC transporter substrate-binding protein n=1 Tax=Dactylosporangium sp. CA-092794 TaxID=3239929 RepID=UPI003D94F231